MRTKVAVRIMSAVIVALLLVSCGVGARKSNDTFFDLKDARLRIIQNRLREVMHERDILRSYLHPILEKVQYLVLALVTLFSALISIFQGIQERPIKKNRIRNTIVVLGIISAIFSATSIYLQNVIGKEKELTNAINAYEACIDSLFIPIDDVMIRKGNFENADDFNTLVKAYDEFNQKLIGVNTAFKDNEYIKSVGNK